MGCSSEAFEKFDRSSLKIIATAGEPINPVASEWLHDVIGEKKRLVIDTYWQTETVLLFLHNFICTLGEHSHWSDSESRKNPTWICNFAILWHKSDNFG